MKHGKRILKVLKVRLKPDLNNLTQNPKEFLFHFEQFFVPFLHQNINVIKIEFFEKSGLHDRILKKSFDTIAKSCQIESMEFFR